MMQTSDAASAAARPIQAWPWFQTTFCQDERYKPPTINMSSAAIAVVPWHHFWTELHKLAFSEGLPEVWWAFDDHQLAQPSQRQVFQGNLWGRVRPSSRDNITAAEFRAAVDLFSYAGGGGGGLADLIESIMKDTPGSRADSTLRLRDHVFLSYTGADTLLGSVSLTSAIYHKLRDKWRVMAFYDTHPLERGDEWRSNKLERCVRSSKVVVVVLSPGFFNRYWCMHELDLALHADPESADRIILPVLLGDGHDFAEDARAKYRQTWQAFTQLSGRPDIEQVLRRWEQNLQQLDGKQRHVAASYGAAAGVIDWESKLVSAVVNQVLHYVVPSAGWQQDALQPQQRQRHVNDLLPGYPVINAAALGQLHSSIEAACKRQAEAMQQPGSAAAAGRQPGSSPRAVPPPVVQLLGKAGMGKSVLALQTAYHYQDTVGCFDGTVHFLRVPPKPQAQTDKLAAVTAAVVQLQRTLLQKLQPDAAANATTPDQLHQALTNAWASAPLQRQTHLLVLDDVWHSDIVKHLRCSTMRGVILVTSRTSILDPTVDDAAVTLELRADADNRKAARELMMGVLQQTHGELSADKQEIVDDVLRTCDGNMLATMVMAAALKGRSSTAAWQEVSNQTKERLEEAVYEHTRGVSGGVPGSDVQPLPVPPKGQCGGHPDRPVAKDALGYSSLARGAAEFLLHSDTKSTTLAVHGCWGSGKSTFMKLLEAEMMLKAGRDQVYDLEREEKGPLHTAYGKLLKKYDPTAGEQQIQDMSPDDLKQLQALASPRLLTVQFNSWQYLTSTEVWSGLVVEVTQRLEEKLSFQQRMVMAQWLPSSWHCWHSWSNRCYTSMQGQDESCCSYCFYWGWVCLVWLRLLLHGQLRLLLHGRLWTAIQYNWRTRPCSVWLRCIAPLFLVLALVGVAMWVGIWELQEQGKRQAAMLSPLPSPTPSLWPSPSPAPAVNTRSSPPGNGSVYSETSQVNKSAVAAVAAIGVVVCLFAGLAAGLTHCKSISDSMIEGAKHLQFKDHSIKLGYQHEVIKDLKHLGDLLRAYFTRFQTVSGNKDMCVVVFIDDLDRCKPSSIVEVLEAINLVLADSGMSVVVGMDKDFVLSSIQTAYKDVKVMQSTAKAAEFLQKIVQVELVLPPKATDMASYMKAQGITLKWEGFELGPDPLAAKEDAETPAALADTEVPASAASAAAQEASTNADTPQAAAVFAADAGTGTAKEAVGPGDPAASDQATAASQAASAKAAAKAAADAAADASKEVASAQKATDEASRDHPGSAKARESDKFARDARKWLQQAEATAKLAADAAARAAAAEGKAAAVLVGLAYNHSDKAQQDVRRALWSSKQAVNAANAATAGRKHTYNTNECQALETLRIRQLLVEVTPREMKRLLNRYLLAKFCCQALDKEQVQPGKVPTNFVEQQLLGWVFLWWRFPVGMRAALKFQRKDPEAERSLAELLQQQHKELQAAQDKKKQQSVMASPDTNTDAAAAAATGPGGSPSTAGAATSSPGVLEPKSRWERWTTPKARGSSSATAAGLDQERDTAVEVDQAADTAAGPDQAADGAAGAAADLQTQPQQQPLSPQEALWAAQAAHKAATKDVRNAGAAISAAAATATVAAGAPTINSSSGVNLPPQETLEARKKAAELQLEEAEEQLQLASIWVLCTDDHQAGKLRELFDLPHNEMVRFKAFAM